MKHLLILMFTLMLQACSNIPSPGDPKFAPVIPDRAEKPSSHNGSLYHQDKGLTLYQDLKAHHVGDIITVMLSETTTASKSAKTEMNKESSATITNPNVFGAETEFNIHPAIPVPLTNKNSLGFSASISGDRESKGDGTSDQNNKLTGEISVVVAQVYPNGNLYVQGEKWITLNQGDEYIRLSGIVRPRDINPDNTISSSRIADARIAYSGRGAINDANKPGWLARIVNSPLWPI